MQHCSSSSDVKYQIGYNVYVEHKCPGRDQVNSKHYLCDQCDDVSRNVIYLLKQNFNCQRKLIYKILYHNVDIIVYPLINIALNLLFF